MSDIALIEQDVYGTKESFLSVLTDRSINFDREAGFAVQSIMGNDYAKKIALNNRQSVVDAVTNIAAIGISLNPAKKQAYLVPRDGKICLDISYMGLLDLAIDSGSILWGQAKLVRDKDTFELNGVDKAPTHLHNPFCADRGEVVGAYVVVKTPQGDYLTECMSREEIDGIMNRSQSVKSGKSSPWKTDWGEMAKKTVVKRAYKYWPKSERLDQAIHYLNTDSGEGLAVINAQPQGPSAESVEWVSKATKAQTKEELEGVWKEGGNVLRSANDKGGYAQLKSAVIERLADLTPRHAPQESAA